METPAKVTCHRLLAVYLLVVKDIPPSEGCDFKNRSLKGILLCPGGQPSTSILQTKHKTFSYEWENQKWLDWVAMTVRWVISGR